MESKSDDFVKNIILKSERRLFFIRILGFAVGYALITMWLNRIRIAASPWLVWTLIIVQFTLYFSIFVAGYRRFVTCGFNEALGVVFFTALAILGRVNDWELVIIPLVVFVMLVVSVRCKNVSDERVKMLPG